MKKQCEAIKTGLAHRMYLPDYITQGKNKEDGTILCQIDENKCPYKQQGRACYDADLGIVHLCNANASVHSNIEPMEKIFHKN